MCGICNIFGRNRRNGCGCGSNRSTCNSDHNYRSRWSEPRMRTHCASGIGTESAMPCGCDDDYNDYSTRSGCGCRRSCDCDCDCD